MLCVWKRAFFSLLKSVAWSVYLVPLLSAIEETVKNCLYSLLCYLWFYITTHTPFTHQSDEPQPFDFCAQDLLHAHLVVFSATSMPLLILQIFFWGGTGRIIKMWVILAVPVILAYSRYFLTVTNLTVTLDVCWALNGLFQKNSKWFQDNSWEAPANLEPFLCIYN